MIALLKSLVKRFCIRKKLHQLGQVGLNVNIGMTTQFYFPSRISLGNHIYVGERTQFHGFGEIVVDDGVIMSDDCLIMSANHRYEGAQAVPYDGDFVCKKVHIKQNVWIGARCIILPGSEIGEGVVVSAGSVVRGKIPDFAVIAGNPAKIVKYRDENQYLQLVKDNKVYIKMKAEGLMHPNYN